MSDKIIKILKRCIECEQHKDISLYCLHKVNKDGLSSYCRPCHIKKLSDYRKTTTGLASKIYSSQKQSSKRRGHATPNYSMYELLSWMESQQNFNELFSNWKESDYSKNLVPSVDRINDYKPYTFDNIQLTTWEKNKFRGESDKKAGINNKTNKGVIQYSIDGVCLNIYHSIQEAERKTGINNSHISSVCNGKRNKAGGFLWKHK